MCKNLSKINLSGEACKQKPILKLPGLVMLGLLTVAFSCKQATEHQPLVVPQVWPHGTMYEIFVQSFADTNNDGIGDFNGVTAKLDYLADLGIQGIWFMPINPSPSYHKYDVTDYYNVHPDYGTMADFKKLVQEAHNRNIKIIIDLVINHTSSEHPWFKAAMANKNSPYRNYYVWANIDSVKDNLHKKTITLDSDNITQWHKPAGNDTTQFYYGFFYGGMPDLNYDNPAVRAEMIKVGTYWLKEVGVDGFRLDAAKHIFPDERAKDSHTWWVEFGDAMRKIKPDVYMVGEVWGNAQLVGPYLKGLPAMFNFDFFHAINRLLQTEQNNGMVDSLIKARAIYQAIQPHYLDAIFVNNHDQNRLISNVGGDIAKNKLAFAILLTLPGTPYIYYGDEIAMLGKKPDEMIREPFLWDMPSKDSLRTTWLVPENSTDSTVEPLALQMKDSASIYTTIKSWIHLRNDSPILRNGSLSTLKTNPDLVAYARSWKDMRWVIVHNITSRTATLNLKDMKAAKLMHYVGQAPFVTDTTVQLRPYQSVILH